MSLRVRYLCNAGERNSVSGHSKSTYVNDTHDVEGLTLGSYHQTSFPPRMIIKEREPCTHADAIPKDVRSVLHAVLIEASSL